MLFRQILNEDLGCASYMVACGGEAAIIDPQLDIEPYLSIAREHDLRITRVLETHNHADHVSGHSRLVEATGATVYASADGGAEYPHEPLREGDSIRFGNAELRVIPTPGHRPEHVAFALIDHGRSEQPWALLTGDSLLVGDVARPDLAVAQDEGAAGLHESVSRLLDQADHVEVWPGHIGGSLCGSSRLSGKTASTVGYERSANPLLTISDPERFEAALTEGLKPKPPNFTDIVARNQGPFVTPNLQLRRLTPNDLTQLASAGARIIDTRSAHDFDEGHIPDSISVPADDSGVGTRASWQIDTSDEVVLVTRDAQEAERVARLLAAVAIDHVAGYLDGGLGAWVAAGHDVQSSRTWSPERLAAELLNDEIMLLDVRDPDEFVAGHVPGSTNIPYYHLIGDSAEQVGALGGTIAVACKSGARAAQAVSMLARAGITNTVHVDGGGIPDLARFGVHLESGPSPVTHA